LPFDGGLQAETQPASAGFSLGEMLKAQKESGGMQKPGPKDSSRDASELPPKLSEMEISHSISTRPVYRHPAIRS
jgi:hypothetical protein